MLPAWTRKELLEIELGTLAAHLHERRAAMLASWSRAAQSEPKLTTATTLSRAQFYDHIPNMLEALERKLRSMRLRDQLSASRKQATNAEGHDLPGQPQHRAKG